MQLPSYDAVLVELHATLEALIRNARTPEIKEGAKKRLLEINSIEKKRDGSYFINQQALPRSSD